MGGAPPIRALRKLDTLNCWGGAEGPPPAPPRSGALTDLSPLRGMPLVDLRFPGNPVRDLSPLKGMPLQVLWCWNSRVRDLSALRGMPLVELGLDGTEVTDLSPIKEAPLRVLNARVPHLNFSPLLGSQTLETINDQPAADFLKHLVNGRAPPPW